MRSLCRIEQREVRCSVILRLTIRCVMNEDNTLDRLHELSDRLAERLTEAEHVRARFTKAHDANVWPDLRPACRDTDVPKLRYFRPADRYRRTH
jgi:hypothetical protein